MVIFCLWIVVDGKYKDDAPVTALSWWAFRARRVLRANSWREGVLCIVWEYSHYGGRGVVVCASTPKHLNLDVWVRLTKNNVHGCTSFESLTIFKEYSNVCLEKSSQTRPFGAVMPDFMVLITHSNNEKNPFSPRSCLKIPTILPTKIYTQKKQNYCMKKQQKQIQYFNNKTRNNEINVHL